MKRREFIRLLGGTAVITATAPGYAISSGQYADKGVLVEASAFDDFGGWVLDTQFYQQMGGNYLLAHGIGKPVANARTRVRFPERGSWHIYVRTKNWCKGPWEAPGRFQLMLNGRVIDKEIGSGEPRWTWQSLGSLELDAGEYDLEVQDLTGFDGRFDAIYFSPIESPILPDSSADVMAWKDELSGRSDKKIKQETFDLVIVGGGITGCAAALAADSQGLRVALIQDRPIFGGNASEEIRVHTLGVHGKGAGILERIDTVHYPNGSEKAKLDQWKREASMEESGVHLYPNFSAIGLEKEGTSIRSVDARHTRNGEIIRFRAKQFIDCTGDAWLGYWAGAEYRYGRESYKEFGEQWEEHGDLWAPEQADKRVMGSSVLWNSQVEQEPSTFPEVPWAMPIAKRASALEGEWFWEYSDNELNQIEDAEHIRDHLFRAIYGNFYNAKKHPRNVLVSLKWVAFIAGRRESRRIMGDYIYSMKDATERREFDDVVVEEKRVLDTHYQLSEQGHSASYLSEALFRHTGSLYFIPFRCLYSKDIDNLMMAGRCFSCSHIGLSGPRVMNTCGQMGIATGYAAALCKRYEVNPRELGKKHIAELKKLVGYV